MANPYSYDLRRKVIQAIELDSMKKSEAAQVFGISRNTIDLWLKRRGETGDYQARGPDNRQEMDTKLLIGRSFESLQPTMAIKLKWKWRSFGKVKSVRGQFLVPCTRSVLHEKKDLWLH